MKAKSWDSSWKNLHVQVRRYLHNTDTTDLQNNLEKFFANKLDIRITSYYYVVIIVSKVSSREYVSLLRVNSTRKINEEILSLTP